MALDLTSGNSAVMAPADMGDPQRPMFTVQSVDLQFSIASDFVAAQVANGVLVLALYSGRIMRIDLDSAEDIEDIDLPKKASEVGIIRRLFLDPTASHLIINTTSSENYYLHSQSRQPRTLSRLKGVPIESVAWNASQPTASTREILIGASNGDVYETYIEPSTEFYKRDEKYLKNVYRTTGPITGLWTEVVPGKPDHRTVLVATSGGSRGSADKDCLFRFSGRIGRHGAEGSGSIFSKLFESESPTVREDPVSRSAQVPSSGKSRSGAASPPTLTFTPDPPDMPNVAESSRPDKIFGWWSPEGIHYGEFSKDILDAKILPPIKTRHEQTGLMALTQWHVLQLVDGRVVASNRLDHTTVYDQMVLDPGQRAIALMADVKRNEYWIFTTKEIFEVKVDDEDRDIWRILLKEQKLEEALQYANSPAEKDAVATASGDYLLKQGQYLEAASVYGKSSKAFEQVALGFIDEGQKDALRKYLTVKLSTLKKTSIMQRTLLASWLIELFMAKLNSLDDMITMEAELAENQTPSDFKTQLKSVRQEYQDFVSKHKADLDRKTTYDIVSSHGREHELLYYATAVDDYNYVLSYWVQREDWAMALTALKKQTSAEVIYKYSSVLMASVAVGFVDILMRQSNLDALKLIPALLNYNSVVDVPLSQNQAVRYLRFEIDQNHSTDTAIHNTLISIYASNSSPDESELLAYLETQAPSTASPSSVSLPYDADFALRLCIQTSRIRSCVHIYSTMGQHLSAVELALQHNEIELAIVVASRPEHDAALRKKLWLAIAKQVISQASAPSAPASPKSPKSATSTKSPKSPTSTKSPKPPTSPKSPKSPKPRTAPARQSAMDVEKAKALSTGPSISTALSLLRRAPPHTLRIEDLLPLFPSFILIDAFKADICAALEAYSTSIDTLRSEMDASAATAARLAADAASATSARFVLVQPADACALCALPLLDRRFWLFPCQHGFHAECLADAVVARAGSGSGGGSGGVGARVRDLRSVLARAEVQGRRREAVALELDDLLRAECVLCGGVGVRLVDRPFVGEEERARGAAEWAV